MKTFCLTSIYGGNHLEIKIILASIKFPLRVVVAIACKMSKILEHLFKIRYFSNCQLKDKLIPSSQERLSPICGGGDIHSLLLFFNVVVFIKLFTTLFVFGKDGIFLAIGSIGV